MALPSVFSGGDMPRNWMRDATISVRWCLPPLFFASKSRVPPFDLNLPSLLQVLVTNLGEFLACTPDAHQFISRVGYRFPRQVGEIALTGLSRADSIGINAPRLEWGRR